MKNPTLEEFRLNPDLMDALIARARRERSRAVGDAIVALFFGIGKRLTPPAGLGRLLTRMG